MKKLVTLVLALGLAVIGQAAYAEEPAINVVAEGAVLEFNEADGYGLPFVDENNRTQLPLRKCLESLGAEVEYEAEDQKITVTKGDNTAVLQIDSAVMTVNAEETMMDTVPIIKNGRTYLPIRPVAEAIGYQVNWQEDDQTAVIAKEISGEKAEIVDLSEYLKTNANSFQTWTMFNGDLYYYDQNNNLMRLAEADLTKNGEAVYALQAGEMIPLLALEDLGDYLLGGYATGGMMGSNIYHLWNENGLVQKIESSTMMPLTFTPYHDALLVTGRGGSNLELWQGEEQVEIEQDNLVFNRLYTSVDSYPIGEPIIWQDKVYLAAYQAAEKQYYWAEVEPESQKVTLLYNIQPAKISGGKDKLYCLSSDGQLLAYDGETVEYLRDGMNDFAIAGDSVWLIQDEKLLLLGSEEALYPKLNAAELYSLGDYLLCTAKKGVKLLLDSQGKIMHAFVKGGELQTLGAKIYWAE